MDIVYSTIITPAHSIEYMGTYPCIQCKANRGRRRLNYVDMLRKDTSWSPREERDTNQIS